MPINQSKKDRSKVAPSQVRKSKAERTAKKPTIPIRISKKKLIGLDTNTLMDDYLAMYRFKYARNDIFIPLKVLLELNANKKPKGKSKKEIDAAENARKAAIILLILAESVPISKIKYGIPLLKPGEIVPHGMSRQKYLAKKGKLFFELPKDGELEKYLDSEDPDQNILLSCVEREKELKLKEGNDSEFVLVSGDTIMRILGLLVGLRTEKYENKAVSDESYRSTGIHYFPLGLLESQKTDNGITPRPIPEQDGEKEYVFKSKLFNSIVMYEFLIFGPPDDPVTKKQLEPEKQRQYIVLEKLSPQSIRVRELKDFQYQNKILFRVNALNAEQNCYANAVLVYRAALVIGEGPAGTGKTFFALACAYHLIAEGVYPNVIVSRDAVDTGQKLGFFKGGKEEKVGNYLPGSLRSKEKLLEMLSEEISKRRKEEKEQQRKQKANNAGDNPQNNTNTGKQTRKQRKQARSDKNKRMTQRSTTNAHESLAITKLLNLRTLLATSGTILEPANLLRGASIGTILIYDEAQHTDTEHGELIGSRMEADSQLLLIGNVKQDDIGIHLRNSGVAKLIDATRDTDLMCLITFKYVERGPLPDRIALYYNKKKEMR